MLPLNKQGWFVVLYPSFRVVCAASVAVISFTGVAFGQSSAEDVMDVFNTLYGREIAQARNTLTTDDDGKLASKMLDDARDLENRPEFSRLLLEHAYEFGSRDPAGYTAAIEAMRTMMALKPETKEDSLQKALSVQQRLYRSSRPDDRGIIGADLIRMQIELADLKASRTEPGDVHDAINTYRQALSLAGILNDPSRTEIAKKMDQAAMRKRALDRIDTLKGRLENNPLNTTPNRDLLRIYLIELNDPHSALKYAEKVDEPDLTRHLPLAVRPSNELKEADLVGLGSWYFNLAEQAPLAARPAMFRRARDYYRAFLIRHTEEDLQHLQAQLAIKKINQRLGEKEESEEVKKENMFENNSDYPY